MPTESELRSRRDSWPPTQLRFVSSSADKDEPQPLLTDMDEDPLTYFLTPTPALEDDTADDVMLDFDAGIEDPNRAQDAVRSVSPSTLGGLSKPPPRTKSPDFDSDFLTSDDDDDEDYIRFTPGNSRFLSLPDYAIDGRMPRPRSPLSGFGRGDAPSPGTSPTFSARGRSNARRKPVHAWNVSPRSRPGHLWREPSPDVWSIEEETPEEMVVEQVVKARVRPASEGKPLKKVRFILPDAQE